MITEIKHNSPELTNDKLAVFDFDWTLIRPKGATTWCCNREDWQLLYNNAIEVLRDFHQKGYTIIIVTYQTRTYKIDMLNDFIQIFDIPVFLLISDKETKKDFDLVDHLQLSGSFHISSFYCGDADGLPGSWSDMDRVFAERNGIKFYTPTEIFGIENTSIFFKTDNDLDNLDDVIIMCGSPGAGKSSFVREHISPKGYTVVASDDYKGNKKKMAKMITSLLKDGHRVVIDGCNPIQKNRQDWIDVIGDKSHTIIHIDTPKTFALERNSKRTIHKVPAVAIHNWFKRFENTNIDIVVKTVV